MARRGRPPGAKTRKRSYVDSAEGLVTDIRLLTKAEVSRLGNLVVNGNVRALQKLAKDPESTVLMVMLAGVCVKIIEKGDMSALNVLLDRLIGKVKEEGRPFGADAPPPATETRIVVTIPSNGREVPDSELIKEESA